MKKPKKFETLEIQIPNDIFALFNAHAKKSNPKTTPEKMIATWIEATANNEAAYQKFEQERQDRYNELRSKQLPTVKQIFNAKIEHIRGKAKTRVLPQ